MLSIWAQIGPETTVVEGHSRPEACRHRGQYSFFFLLETLNIFVSTRSHFKRLGISKVAEIVKEIVLKEFWGLLKQGGEAKFSTDKF